MSIKQIYVAVLLLRPPYKGRKLERLSNVLKVIYLVNMEPKFNFWLLDPKTQFFPVHTQVESKEKILLFFFQPAMDGKWDRCA